MPRSPLCPCCGYDRSTAPQVPACPCCGDSLNPAGFDNPQAYQDLVNERRQAWILEGMPWGSGDIAQPAGWNPAQHLAQLAQQITLARVKGRPPRAMPMAAEVAE